MDWEPRRRRETRLREIEGQIAATSADVSLRFERACLLAETGRIKEARDAYVDLLSRDPSNLAALNNLGTLLQETGFRSAARTAFAEAVRRHPADITSRVNLANALREGGDPVKARAHYETALELQPDHPEAHQGLACIFTDAGDSMRAKRHRKLGFGGRPVIHLPYRGDGTPVQVLILAGTSGGNAPIRHFLDDGIFQTSILFAEFHAAGMPLPPHGVVFNAIGDADVEGAALKAAESLLKSTTAPLINSPGAVAVTGRSENARRLSDIAGVITSGADEIPRAAFAGLDFEYPLLIRTPGFHTGRYFLRVQRAADLPAAVAELPGDELVAMRYLDARGRDGKVRKYRVMMIDGELFPLHAAISSHWKIHYFTAEMADNPAHRAEDREFLENMAGVMGPRAMAALSEIQSRLGLDYAGIDFGLNTAGDILLFEANAAMVVNPPEPDERWDYRRPAVERIFSAVRNMVMRRADSAAQRQF